MAASLPLRRRHLSVLLVLDAFLQPRDSFPAARRLPVGVDFRRSEEFELLLSFPWRRRFEEAGEQRRRYSRT
jgi:hypothetical protein